MWRFFLILLCGLPLKAIANDWHALNAPDAHLLMRHALAPGTGDPANLTLGDCSTQRNLDERGRAQARATGDALRAAGADFDRVLSSQWCRTMETAELLGFGPVESAPALNSFFNDRSTRDEQTEATRDLLQAAEGRLLLVTHYVNVLALTGETTSSGEGLIIRLTDGAVEVLGRILIDP